jgi:hypothetical protein
VRPQRCFLNDQVSNYRRRRRSTIEGPGVSLLPDAPADKDDCGVKAWPLICVNTLALEQPPICHRSFLIGGEAMEAAASKDPEPYFLGVAAVQQKVGDSFISLGTEGAAIIFL